MLGITSGSFTKYEHNEIFVSSAMWKYCQVLDQQEQSGKSIY